MPKAQTLVPSVKSSQDQHVDLVSSKSHYKRQRGLEGSNHSKSVPIFKVQKPFIQRSLAIANQHRSSFLSCSGQQRFTTYNFPQNSRSIWVSLSKIILSPRLGASIQNYSKSQIGCIHPKLFQVPEIVITKIY